MTAGVQFRLKANVLALCCTGGEPKAIMLPKDAAVIILAGQSSRRKTTEILWEGKILKVFDPDLGGPHVRA